MVEKKYDIEALTDRFYSTAKKCFEVSGTWNEVIKKFPPMAIRSAVRRIVERFVKAEEDPELFDFCDFFTEQLPEFESVEAFIEYLDKKGYIPPDPEKHFAEMLKYLEQEASRLGYRLVKEEEWARVTGRWDRLREEIDRLRAEKKRLEARVKELEQALEEYERTGRYGLRKFIAEPVKPTRPPPSPPPVKPPEPPKRKLIKDAMTYDELLHRLRSYLLLEGLTNYVIDKVFSHAEDYIKEVYETKAMDELPAEMERLMRYIEDEYVKTRCVVVPAVALIGYGIMVREPMPTKIYGVIAKPTISYIYPRFADWAQSLEKAGYTVLYEPISLTPTSHFIHNPGVKPEDVYVAIEKETSLIVLSSADAIGYTMDEQKKKLTWYRYPPCKLLRI